MATGNGSGDGLAHGEAQGLLRTIAALAARNPLPPTAAELARELGLPPTYEEFIDRPLQSELAAGRIEAADGRYRLTQAGTTYLAASP